MTTKHTDGPWEVQRFANQTDTIGIVKMDDEYNGGVVCTLDNYCENRKANAELIAKAPETAAERDRLKELLAWEQDSVRKYEEEYSKLKEINAELLEALEVIVETGERTGEDEHWMCGVAKSAIKKARGE
jgi:uncharacterized protein YukE